MASGGLFSFRPELGETPEILERRRKIAEAMLAGVAGQPATTIGGGLAALGQAIGGRLALGRVNRATAAGQAGAAGLFGELFGGGATAPGETAASPGAVPASSADPVALNAAGLPDVAAMEAEIRRVAPTYGIDPDTAVAVAKSEGLSPNTWQSNITSGGGPGNREPSFGPFQLHDKYLGADFTKATGLRASDPSSWQKQIDFALGQAAKQGWAPWHGAANTGIGEWQGIKRGGGTPAVTAALAGTSGAGGAVGDVGAVGTASSPFKLTYANHNATRNQPVTGDLGSIYDQAARASGVTEVKVISGGQPASGSHRTGSHRHDHGNAGDIQLLVSGRPLDMTNPADLPIIQKFIREASSRGAKGIGAGTDYMGSKTFHVGFGTPAVWGAGGKGANAPDWLRSAVVTGAGGGKGRGSSGRAPVSTGPGAALLAQGNRGQGGGLPAVMEALVGRPGAGGTTGIVGPAGATGTPLLYDPAAKDDLLAENVPQAGFRPAGGPTPYTAGSTVLDAGSANVGAPSPPLPPMRPTVPPVIPAAPPAAPAVAPVAPAASGVAPVAQALGIDPLPQTSGLVGPVASAGHESLSPGAQAVSQALAGGGGTDALAGGGGGLLKRLFGPRGAPAAAAASPVAAALAPETAAVPGTEPVSDTGAPAAGGFSPQAQKAIAVIQNPWSNAGQLAIAKSILDNEISQADPKYRVDLERAREELDQLRNPPKARDLTPQEIVDRGYDPDRAYQEKPDGTIAEVPGTARETITYENLIVDKKTGELIATIPDPGYRAATPEEAAKYGAVAGQFDLSNNKFEPINPPTGFSVEVGADGSVSVVQGPGVGKGLTEGQSKDTVYVTRAEGSLPTLDTYGDALLSFPMRMAEKDPTGFFRSMQSPEFQLAYGAGLEFLQAILRKDTAAAITPAETVEYGRVYLPEPGDGPERLEYKRQARRRAVEAIRAGLPPEAILRLESASESAKKKTGATGDVIPVPEDADTDTATTEPAATVGAPVRISTEDEYQKLKSGTRFIDPEGVIRRKP